MESKIKAQGNTKQPTAQDYQKQVEKQQEMEEQRRILLKEFLTPEAKERSMFILSNYQYVD